MLLRPFLDDFYGLTNGFTGIINHVTQHIAFSHINKRAIITIAVYLPIPITHPVPFFDKFQRVHIHTPVSATACRKNDSCCRRSSTVRA